MITNGKHWVFLSFAAAVLMIFAAFPFFNTENALADGVAEVAMELNTQKVLSSKNAKKRLPMASTTKIMTALLICEDCKLDEEITVSDDAVGIEGSSIYLKHGEKITVKDLLYGLMLVSGNDAACALAIHHSGNVDSFVEKMNEKASALGAVDTHFCNPNGLPNDEHYTTATDLCRIACYALGNETFATVVSTKSYNGKYRSFTNKNKLLKSLDGANGVKTGYTTKAGRCLVSSAKRDGMQVVCVVLNCYDMYERSAFIINDCFNRYKVKLLTKDKIFVCNGKSYSLLRDYTLVVENNESLKYEVFPPSDSEVNAKLNIYAANNLIFSENLFNIK